MYVLSSLAQEKGKQQEELTARYSPKSSDIFIIAVMGYRFEPMVSHLQSLKVGVRNEFLTPTNSHLIRFPITAIIESEIFPNIRPQGEG